jgi:uncharacterized protein YeaO (DUF488 family)
VGVITLARVYDKAEAGDQPRYLVERLWPRGVRRADLRLSDWLPDVGPSHELRKWFGHEPQKWDDFRRRYFAELDEHPQAWQPCATRRPPVTSRCSTARVTPSTTTR